ncbi:MAG TPA: PAS domain-containing protein, partial [Gillisia sp.]|nr:PAS domain-containing protein [Gillisia sp.]
MAQKNLEYKIDRSIEWQETFDAAMDVFALISKDFDIIKMNKAGYKNLGKKLKEVVGMKCYKVVHGLDAPIENCPCQKMLETGKNQASEVSDKGRIYLAPAAPIWDEHRKFYAFAHTVKDITDIKKTENRLNELIDSMEKEVDRRTKELYSVNKKLINEIKERKKSQHALRQSELKLKKQHRSLQNKNAALREIIEQIEVEKKSIKNEISCNVDLILTPLLERLKLDEQASNLADLITYHLRKITSPYGISLNKIVYRLTPRELEICNMVKANLSSKEIAKLLNIS